jgi:hypothetical protein
VTQPTAGALYVKTRITPEEIFRAIGRLRKEARDARSTGLSGSYTKPTTTWSSSPFDDNGEGMRI